MAKPRGFIYRPTVVLTSVLLLRRVSMRGGSLWVPQGARAAIAWRPVAPIYREQELRAFTREVAAVSRLAA
jgi:hypothetical protein